MTSLQPMGIAFLMCLCFLVERTLSIQNDVIRCFDDPPIGCFSNSYPFNYTAQLPFSPDTIDIHYHHAIHSDNFIFPWRSAKDVMKRRFCPELKTVLIIHGFIERGTKDWVIQLVAEFAKLPEPINIIVVDWERGTRKLGYGQSFVNGRVVSRMGALFVKDLIALGASPASFHVIGNSLGSHVAGNLATEIPGLGRVTAMDPPPMYVMDFPPEVRLDATDALVVDVIHTDASKTLGFGSMVPMGTVDFYVNGGMNQPGCSDGSIDIFLEMLIFNKKCSHSRAITLFRESISMCTAMAGKCSSLLDITSKRCTDCRAGGKCVKFGYHLEPNSRGLYAFTTGSESPFC